MLVSDYNYDLPDERIAKFPPRERGTTRLLALDRKTGEKFQPKLCKQILSTKST